MREEKEMFPERVCKLLLGSKAKPSVNRDSLLLSPM